MTDWNVRVNARSSQGGCPMVYVFLAEGFEEIEALAPVDILRRAGVEVRTVGIGGQVVRGAHGVEVRADLTENEAAADGLEMVVLPGGPGTPNLEASAAMQRLLDTAAANGLWIGAICAAPSILGHKGLLRGKRAVCYPGYETELAGAQVEHTAVCTDGRIITGNGPGAALGFGFALAAALAGTEKAEAVRTGMQVR